MRKRRILTWTLFLIVSQLCNQSNAFGQISLYYEEFGVFFYPQKKVDTLEFSITQNYPGCTLKLFLKDYGGECYVELYNKKHKLKMTGYFVNGPDTLTKYRYAIQVGPPLDKKYQTVSLVKYLAPLRKGVWTVYDDHGKVTSKHEYDFRFY